VKDNSIDIYIFTASHLKNPEIPLFTKQLATRLGLAEEPDRKFAERESFGLNRCQIVANGLLELHGQNSDSFSSRMTAILAQFSLVGINLQCPYINSNSQDIYSILK
jgi:HopA1 effector protein family